MSESLVSIIVTTKNEAPNIVRCMQSLREQSYAPIEIILVDNNSSDGTKSLAAPYADLVLNHGPERCSQRNYGLAKATGAYVCFVDADMELAPDVIRSCMKLAEGGANSIVVPEVSVGEGFWSRCKAFEKRVYEGDQNVEAPRFFLKTIIESVGGYDESLHAFEDWDLAHRIDLVAPRARISEPILHHEGALSLARTFTKKRYYARSYDAYRSKHPAAARRQISVTRLRAFRRRLKDEPIVALGAMLMKLTEFIGFIFGHYLDAHQK